MPTVEQFQESLGRRGRAYCTVRFTQSDQSGISENNEVVKVADLGSRINSPRIRVDTVSWSTTGSGTARGVLEFDSMPPAEDSKIADIPPGTVNSIDFNAAPSGGIPDPVRLGPGNVVLSIYDALPDDVVSVWVNFTEKGTSKP